MSNKVTIAAAGLSAVLATAANPQDCAEEKSWVDTGNVAKALFANPVENWNGPLIQTFSAEDLSKLAKEARDIAKDLGDDADGIFKDIRKSTEKAKDTKWDKILDNAHPAIVPALTDLKNGVINIDQAESQANTAISAYAKAATDMIASLSGTGRPACVVYTGPAPAGQ